VCTSAELWERNRTATLIASLNAAGQLEPDIACGMRLPKSSTVLSSRRERKPVLPARQSRRPQVPDRGPRGLMHAPIPVHSFLLPSCWTSQSCKIYTVPVHRSAVLRHSPHGALPRLESVNQRQQSIEMLDDSDRVRVEFARATILRSSNTLDFELPPPRVVVVGRPSADQAGDDLGHSAMLLWELGTSIRFSNMLARL
jgi:hypothetical protein